MVEDDCCNRGNAQKQDFDSQYRYPVHVEQAQEGVVLAEGVIAHHASIGLEHEYAVRAGGKRKGDAEDAAGDVERIDRFARLGQGSLMKVGEGGMMGVWVSRRQGGLGVWAA
jgi:hypothetical protein